MNRGLLTDNVALPSTTGRIRKGTTTKEIKKPVFSHDEPRFDIQYSKSNRDRCDVCEKRIMQKEIRVGKIVEANAATIIPPRYHVDCFASVREELEFFASGGALAGIDALTVEDQDKVMKILSKSGPVPRKRKIENDDDRNEDCENEDEVAFENEDEVDMYRRKLKGVHELHLVELLEANDQDAPKESKTTKTIKIKMCDRLADCMVFGALERCPVCKNGQLEFRPGTGYFCLGLDQWVNCESVFDEPARRPFIVPAHLRQTYDFLQNYKCEKTRKRSFEKKATNTPFAKKKLVTMATSTPTTSYEFGKSKKKFKIKNGVAVDPQFSMASSTHVYRDPAGNIYSASLSLTDLQTRKNIFYKIQVLEGEKIFRDAWNRMYTSIWLFRSWGRIGTKGKSSESRMILTEAVRTFEQIFLEQTGNSWKDRNAFKKVPGKKVMLDISYGRNDPDIAGQSSKLEKPVQELIALIYDHNFMIQTVKEMELDFDKMPLGKLSKKQIQEAYDVLKKLQDIITEQGETKVCYKILISFTNEFYSLIPHNFGNNNPPLLSTLHAIQRKTKMLDTLKQIELAYSLSLKQSNGGDSTPEIDLYYDRLNATLRTMERTDPEFGMLEKCLQNTHCPTHDSYRLEIVQIFKVERHGENERFKKLNNRRLLWHGSRLTNFVGILSQGLRIAPPEAPSSGYMFGKGIYFADMVSKAANYCKASKFNNNGLLLLCEVALGQVDVMFTAQSQLVKPREGWDSVMGSGCMIPSSADTKVLADNVLIELGQGIPYFAPSSTRPLRYNEYIVYDPAQVKIRYLLQVKFNFIKPAVIS